MATAEQRSKSALGKEIHVPEWEHIAAKEARGESGHDGSEKKSIAMTLAARLDAVLPPQRKYLRMQRKTFLLVLLGTVLALLALIIGLAAGLSHRSSGGKNLPLPSNTASFTGDLTYFDPGLGACGETSTSGDKIVAVSEILFDKAGSTSTDGGNSNANPLCNRMIRAQRYNEDAGEVRTVDLKVVDRCTGCAVDDLDVTESAFEKLAPIASGRVSVTWAWLGVAPTGS